MSLRAAVLVTLFAAALATAATAQDDSLVTDNIPLMTEISVGDSYAGQLVAGGDSLADGAWFEPFWFSGEAGDTVTMSIASIDFNAYLLLADSTYTIIETDDDSGGECNPHLSYVLPESGGYYLYVSSTYRNKIGQYEVSILPGTVPPRSSKQCGGFFDLKGKLALGEPIEGTLGPPDPKHARLVVVGSGAPLKVMLRTGKADETGDFTLSMVAGALPLVEESQCLP